MDTNIPIDEVVHFDAITSDSTGEVSDADSTPTWAVFEEDNDTAILGGNFTKRTSLTGNYRGSFTVSAANGFEAGKYYSVIGSATVDSKPGKCVCSMFRCVPAENVTGLPQVDVTNMADAVYVGIADEFLDRDMSLGTDSGSTTVRTVRQALRFLRNKWVITSGQLFVYKEDDSTASWSSDVSTDNTADPIVGNDPAGP
jgi:hypothetical protein